MAGAGRALPRGPGAFAREPATGRIGLAGQPPGRAQESARTAKGARRESYSRALLRRRGVARATFAALLHIPLQGQTRYRGARHDELFASAPGPAPRRLAGDARVSRRS